MSALQTYFLSNHFSNPFYQRWVPGGSHSETRWENGSTNSHVTMRRFFSEEQGNAQAGVLNDILL